METQRYRDEERFRVELLEFRRKIDKMIFDLVDKRDEERIQSIKGRNQALAPAPGGLIRILPADDLPEDPNAIETDKSGGPERHL